MLNCKSNEVLKNDRELNSSWRVSEAPRVSYVEKAESSRELELIIYCIWKGEEDFKFHEIQWLYESSTVAEWK